MTVSQKAIPVQFEKLDQTIQEIFTTTATTLAKETHFVQRTSELNGARFAQALVFGWLANPTAGYTFLQSMLELVGCDVSAQALEQRMTPQAADFLQSLLSAFTYANVASEPVVSELFNRFDGVWVQDGTVIGLPGEMEYVYKGFGGRTKESGKSALRLQARLNLSTGALDGPWITSARTCEREGEGSMQQKPLPANSLFLTDTHYVTLHEISEHRTQKRWWASHARSDMVITDVCARRYTLFDFVQARSDAMATIDEWVTIGCQKASQQYVRILIFPFSKGKSDAEKKQVGKNTKQRKKGCRGDAKVGKKHEATKTKSHRNKPSQKRLALSGWTILLTNIPNEKAQAHEIRILVRCRWQIELVWRLWKERGHVDIWKTNKRMRVMCEVYAKLMGCIVQHWVLVTGCWHHPYRSLVKASQIVPALIAGYLLSWSGHLTPADMLAALARAMKRCRVNTRPKRFSMAQMVEEPSCVLKGGIAS
jgi:Transposase DDE domain